MNWKEIKELQERKAALKAEAEKVYTRSATGVKAEDQKEYDAILSDMETTQKRIDNATKLASLSGEDGTQTRAVAPTVETKANTREEQREEFRSLLTSSVSGSIVGPTYFADDFVKTLSTKVGILDIGATIIRTETGTPFYVPVVDDTANSASVVAEGGARSVGTDPLLTNVTLGSFTYSSEIIKVAPQMIRDHFSSFEKLVLDLCAERLARKIAYDTTLGDGSSKIKGFMYGLGASLTSAGGSIGQPWTYGELTNLYYQLDSGHRADPASVFVASSSAAAALAGLTFGSGTQVWAPGVTRTIEGKPIKEFHNMAAVGGSAQSLAFINPKKYFFRIVGAPRITILKELYAANGLWGILVEQDCDGRLVDAAAVKSIACKGGIV